MQLGLLGFLLLGFFEQRFATINFEAAKWTRTVEQSCRIYTANENGANVEVVRLEANNLVGFRASKGLRVAICGSVAAFDEGFEATGKVTEPKH